MTRILIVDDNEQNNYYLKSLLTGHGYEVEVADQGADALVKAKQIKPDVIISDLLMPVMDGFTLLKHWKSDVVLSNAPFIVYTATYTEPEDEMLAFSLGADGFLLKPAEPEVILAKIVQVMERAVTTGSSPSDFPLRDEKELLKHYSEALIRKLEQKTQQLEETNRTMQRDIAERIRTEEALRESEERFRGTFEQAAVGIAHVSLDGRFLRVNDKFCNIVDHDRDELVSMSFEDLTYHEDFADGEAGRRAMLANETTSFITEKRYQRKHGGVVWTNLWSTVARTASGEPAYFISVLTDITRRKNAEAALQKANDELELRVKDRTAELEAANESLRIENIEHQRTLTTLQATALSLEKAKEEADAANRAKSDFLSRMSHELRTPLNAILGYGQLIDMRLGQEAHDDISQILRAGRHLLELINEILEISRIEAGHLSLSPEPVSITTTKRLAFDLVRPLAKARNIEIFDDQLTDNAEYFVFADPQRLKQILVNLLSNAIKYNRQGGQVNVFSTVVEGPVAQIDEVSVSEYLRISIRDTGPGISSSDISRLFMPFERLGANISNIEGTGIGLSLCKLLVEAMQGKIGVESTVGAGSIFWVNLPLVKTVHGSTSNEDQAVSRPSLGMKSHSLTILYVEDNESNFDLIERAFALQSPNVQLLKSEQGGAAMSLARVHLPDLILLDLHLKDMNGDEILQRLRTDPMTRHIPIIMLSADATTGQIERLLAAGAHAYLTKPLDLPHFFEVVSQTLHASGKDATVLDHTK